MNIQLIRMVDSIDSKFKLSHNVKNAMLKTPREIFIPSGMLHIAYNLDAIPLGAKQFISSPFTVAKMTQYLQSDGCDSVLEIGCGSGYQAAVLSKIFRRVFSIERIERLRQEAIERFRILGIMNIHTRFSDGQEGWEKFAPFDRILFSAAVECIPQKIIDQLSDGGILVAPIIESNGNQVIKRFIKKNSRLQILDTKGVCSFVLVKNNVENI
ncbi:protein-L-isoaspartate O-methyltransferase [Helicobacter sp. 16-1353]|uniref:protein-L-isoaspartate(D-aspartate) O-methyltransferase n=1 Tax=Helicobacter sp. 16-1353 TaxID=2004996 RepID=UPI000DCCF352|nr:protein-L-isoaspartate(D-aspartate) O-methyltransferase [Helicobacter sp. 16-1353]RAX53852.1 protein-L-isoaspartate O-methyltransferase [Helicobacter sp. 16-1353]